MARKARSYGATRFDPRTGMYVTRSTGRRRARSTSGLGSLASLGQFGQSSSIKGMLGGIKGVLITGSIAAGGAILTNQIFDRVAANWNIEGWKRDLAKIGTGIALAILIAKVTKKPKLAAAFAIGPVVAGAMKLFGDVMGDTAGLGFVSYSPSTAYSDMYAPLYGSENLGLNTFEQASGPAAQYPPAPVASVVSGAM